MDPVSAIGIVAAACQFAELAAKGAIKGAGLLKRLKDTPSKLTELLGIVQTSKRNMVQLRDHLTHPTLMSLSPQLQLQFFRDDIDKAYKVAEELELQIESLVGPPYQDLRGIKRLWRDVITVKKEGEFNDRFETIQRYNEQIHRGLSSVQLALSTRNLETTVAIGTRVDENTTVLAEIKDKVYELNSRKTDVDIDVNVRGSSLIGVQQTRASPATTRVEFELRLEPATIRDEIRSELMLLMTGQAPYASSANTLLPILSRLSHEDRAELASMLVMNQLQHPNDPRRHSSSAAARRSFDRYPAFGPPICGCNIDTYKTGRAFRRGPFSFGYGYQNQKRHHTSCPYSGGEAVKHTWKYQLCMQLLPLVNKTVQFAFSATIGEGGFELRFPLKVFPTVQRSRSEIFMLFDNFTERCAEVDFSSKYHNQRLFLAWERERSLSEGNLPDYHYVYGFMWNIDRVREELRYIHRVLRDAHTLQLGSIRDIDESGYTVLHELIILIIQLTSVYSHIIPEITNLLNLVSISGIDAHAVADESGPRRYKLLPCLYSTTEPFEISLEQNMLTEASPLDSAAEAVRTTLPLFAQLIHANEQPYLPFDLLLTMMSLDFNRSRVEVGEVPTNVIYYDMDGHAAGFDHDIWQPGPEMYASAHRGLLRLLRRNPDLSTSIFEGELARIVLDRDLRNLERFLTLPTLDWKAQAFGFTGISILDLAVGWSEGLQALSALWTWDASCTFWLAFLISDDTSCHQILDLFFMPMNSYTFIRLMMDFVKADAMDWAQAVVKSHVRKRTELAALGRQHLSPFDRKRLGLSKTEVGLLDGHAREVYDLLKKKGIQVSLALHPGWHGSIYCVLGTFSDDHHGERGYLNHIRFPTSTEARESFLLVAVAQQLFDHGFTVVDKAQVLNILPTRSRKRQQLVQTPLQRATRHFPGFAGLPICLWLLQKGASPNFPLAIHDNEQDFPGIYNRSSGSLLERLAVGCHTQPDSHWSLIRLLVQYVSGLCAPMSTDSCVCYCLASDGCSPQHLHISCDYDTGDCNRHEHTGNALVSWIELCFLKHDEKSLCFEQAVRLELFDRLGLVHTCCLALKNKKSLPKPEEVERIRDDDEELASQLDLLMLAYRGSLLMFFQRQHESEEYSTEFDCGCNEAEGLGKKPPSWGSHNLDGHTTRLLAHWRHWWSLTDPILTDIYGITREELWNAYRENVFGVAGDWYSESDMVRVLADMRTGQKLEEMGFGDLDYKQVIEQHFHEELAYARENINPASGEDGNYWEKKFDEAPFVPVYRPELLDELMERLRRAVSGQDEMWTRETEIWSEDPWDSDRE